MNMGWRYGLRARIGLINIETWLAIIASWLSPYPWYADVAIALAVDVTAVVVARRRERDESNT